MPKLSITAIMCLSALIMLAPCTLAAGSAKTRRTSVTDEEIAMHQSRRLSVRIPDWADLRQVVANDGQGKGSAFDVKGRWLHFGEVRAGGRILVTYPLTERISTETVGGAGKSMGFSPVAEQRTYTVTWRGNIVVGMKPTPKALPVFPSRQATRQQK